MILLKYIITKIYIHYLCAYVRCSLFDDLSRERLAEKAEDIVELIGGQEVPGIFSL